MNLLVNMLYFIGLITFITAAGLGMYDIIVWFATKIDKDMRELAKLKAQKKLLDEKDI